MVRMLSILIASGLVIILLVTLKPEKQAIENINTAVGTPTPTKTLSDKNKPSKNTDVSKEAPPLINDKFVNLMEGLDKKISGLVEKVAVLEAYNWEEKVLEQNAELAKVAKKKEQALPKNQAPIVKTKVVEAIVATTPKLIKTQSFKHLETKDKKIDKAEEIVEIAEVADKQVIPADKIEIKQAKPSTQAMTSTQADPSTQENKSVQVSSSMATQYSRMQSPPEPLIDLVYNGKVTQTLAEVKTKETLKIEKNELFSQLDTALEGKKKSEQAVNKPNYQSKHTMKEVIAVNRDNTQLFQKIEKLFN